MHTLQISQIPPFHPPRQKHMQAWGVKRITSPAFWSDTVNLIYVLPSKEYPVC